MTEEVFMTSNRIVEFINETLVEGRDVAEGTELFSSGLLDSFHLAELLLFLDEEFGVKISPSEIRPELMNTAVAIGRLVESKLD